MMTNVGNNAAEIVKVYMPELKERMLFVPHGNKVLGFMTIPASSTQVMCCLQSWVNHISIF